MSASGKRAASTSPEGQREKKRGRPKGSKNKTAPSKPAPKNTAKSTPKHAPKPAPKATPKETNGAESEKDTAGEGGKKRKRQTKGDGKALLSSVMDQAPTSSASKKKTPQKTPTDMETLHKALFRDHSLKVVKVATLQKSHRSSLLDRGFKETDEVVFCEACNGPRSNWDLDSLRQHLTGIKHTELLARLMEKKGTKVKKTHPEDDADKNDDEAEDEDEEEKEVRVTTGLFSKTEKNKMFARAALYGGSTSGQARHFRNAAAKLYGDPSISKGALVEMHIDKIFQEDMEVVLEDLQRSGTIQLLFDGAVVLGNHILAVSGGSTGKWIDTFVNRSGSTTKHENIALMLSILREKHPDTASFCADAASYNVKALMELADVKGLIVFLCVAHAVHNILKSYTEKHYPDVYKLLTKLRTSMSKASTRNKRYVAFQESLRSAAPVSEEEATSFLTSQLNALELALKDGAMSEETVNASVGAMGIGVNTMAAAWDHVKNERDQHQARKHGCAKPLSATTLIASKGTRFNSTYALMQHALPRTLPFLYLIPSSSHAGK